MEKSLRHLCKKGKKNIPDFIYVHFYNIMGSKNFHSIFKTPEFYLLGSIKKTWKITMWLFLTESEKSLTE